MLPWSTKEFQKAWQHERYIAWRKFYRKEFNTLQEFRDFAQKCLKSRNDKSHLVLTTGEDLIKLADQADKLVKGRPAFQIFFLVICAEAIYRILKNLPHKRNISSKSVRHFCKVYFSSDDQKKFQKWFQRSLADEKIQATGTGMSIEEIIDYFYRIRCEIAHQGRYWGFFGQATMRIK